MNDVKLNQNVIWNNIKNISFGTYTKSEINNMSIKSINISETIDNEEIVIDGGLNDRALGTTDFFTNCTTCRAPHNYCPGHIASISLEFPIYNPILFQELYNFIHLICIKCFSLNISNSEREIIKTKIYLLKNNANYINQKEDDEKNITNSITYNTQHITSQINIQKKSLIKYLFNLKKEFCSKCSFKTYIRLDEGNKIIITKKSDTKSLEYNKENKKEYTFTPKEIYNILKKIWKEEVILEEIFGINKDIYNYKDNLYTSTNDFESFFVNEIIVTPTRFRPNEFINNQLYEHHKTMTYKKIIQIKKYLNRIKNKSEKTKEENIALENGWFLIQKEYNKFYSNKDEKGNIGGGTQIKSIGLKELLEKKQGLLRNNLMGKRVNYSCRSVVSPDIWIHSTEIGIPLIFAKSLTYPEAVTKFNYKEMRQAIINGPNVHPGANFIEHQNGMKIDLSTRTRHDRIILANSLLLNDDYINTNTLYHYNTTPKKIYRHLKDGDHVLVNRQPTLHKASMMSHRVKVLYGSHVLRLHYSNCNTYNADFDGDEINVHAPQNELAKAECSMINSNFRQYFSPKNGRPLRGLVQDHVCGGYLFSKTDTFFTKEEYQSYVYTTIAGFDLTKVLKIETINPAIEKPIRLWTGKQILTTILNHISGENKKLNLISKTQTPSLNSDELETFSEIVTIINNEWLTGVCDKAQIGTNKNGVISAVHELYGPVASDDLLTKFGRLFSMFLQNKGLTASTSDLILKDYIEESRDYNRLKIDQKSILIGSDFASLNNYIGSKTEVSNKVKDKITATNGEIILDNKMKEFLNPITSEISDSTFPDGMMVRFPKNNFATMVLSGGKGSRVNISQICALLGQQELEGKRVPRMISGKTLPCYSPYDLSAKAGGYISDRFLTGILPEQYFFHSMAGREGLVDTAIKTARSGYLQRCLVKHLEDLHISYDNTVRNSNGEIYQFYYGEDGIDPQKSTFIRNFSFIKNNMDSYLNKYNINQLRSDSKSDKYIKKMNSDYSKFVSKYDPIMTFKNPLHDLGCISERLLRDINDYYPESDLSTEEMRKFRDIIFNKYRNSLIEAGTGVGIIAAQSIGEPSTQMTLNTFHLAGHGKANVTLGIPRLREIIMTGSVSIKTPTMEFGFLKDIYNPELADLFAEKLSILKFTKITKSIECTESIDKENFIFILKFYIKKLPSYIKWKTIKKIFESRLIARLIKMIDISLNEDDSQNEYKKIFEVKMYKNEQIEEEKKYVEEFSRLDLEEEEELSEDDSEERVYIDSDSVKSSDIEIKEEKNKTKKRRNKSNKKKDELFNLDYIKKLKYEKVNGENIIIIELKIPNTSRKLLIVPIIKSILENVRIHFTKNIEKCYVLKSENLSRKGNMQSKIQTMGVNFRALWKRQDVIDVNSIMSNDIHAIKETYGIEACRSVIIKEIQNVFGVYGISIDNRHLTLIADTMTWSGNYKAFNRERFIDISSPFLKLSYESAMRVLKNSVFVRETDENVNASSRIVTGHVAKLGTGFFDLLYKM